MSKGYVYVLSNPSIPGLLKIGHSIHGGQKRANQLFQTGTPAPFSVEFEILVDDARVIEARTHEKLQRYREYEKREFFRVDVHDATLAIIGAVADCFDHRIEQADMVGAIDDLCYHASIVNEHPIIVCSSVRFISEFAMRDAVSKYHKWAEARRAEYEAKKNG